MKISRRRWVVLGLVLAVVLAGALVAVLLAYPAWSAGCWSSTGRQVTARSW